MKAVPQFPAGPLTVISWPDEVIDKTGHDPRSRYVERFWLGVLGPSTTLLLRRFADELELHPHGFSLDIEETAACLGLGIRAGRNSPFIRAMGRLCQFELAQLQSTNLLAVRTRVPNLARRHILRLPESARAHHDEWTQRQLLNA